MGDEPLRAQGARLSTLPERLGALGAFLAEAAPLWKPRPFASGDALPWVEAHPEAARWLTALDHAALDAIEARGLPPTAPPWLHALAHDNQTRHVVAAITAPAMTRTAARVPGRKISQIDHFAVACGPIAGPIVDWCGGKGHLGRTLGAMSSQLVTVVERDVRLRPDALALAAAADVQLTFVCVDVLGGAADALLCRASHGVALHACGDLGLRFLEVGVGNDVAALALAPCCLHKGPWRALSRAGRAADPGIDHSALRLATSDEVVARPALRQSRQRENAFRQGLDLLVRAASGRDAYTPLGTLPHALVRADFATFCRGAAALRGLALPDRWDPKDAEAAGWRSALRARALGVVRAAFRRSIELWVALDRACFLVEAGFDVRVEAFCPRAVTPRNLLVSARRGG